VSGSPGACCHPQWFVVLERVANRAPREHHHVLARHTVRSRLVQTSITSDEPIEPQRIWVGVQRYTVVSSAWAKWKRFQGKRHRRSLITLFGAPIVQVRGRDPSPWCLALR
jgi:hypothetical protein